MLDVGCGTGTFACLLARRGYTVTGVEPAAAMLAATRAKPGAEWVHWVHGDAKDLPDLRADLAVMTGNTAQVFLTDQDWAAVLDAASAALRPGGHLVFEVRDPAGQPWLGWNRDATLASPRRVRGRQVETWWDLTGVTGELVSFRRTFVFAADGARLSSPSRAPRTGLNGPMSLASTRRLAWTAGLLYQLGVDHPWRSAGTAYCWRQLESGGLPGDTHALIESLVFLEHVPDRGSGRTACRRARV